jgi:hypothetical protein
LLEHRNPAIQVAPVLHHLAVIGRHTLLELLEAYTRCLYVFLALPYELYPAMRHSLGLLLQALNDALEAGRHLLHVIAQLRGGGGEVAFDMR